MPRKIALLAKRGMDILGAAAGGALLSPVLTATALAALVTQGRPIFFRQTRPGLRGMPFSILKFRTMAPLRPDQIQYFSD